MMLRSSLNTLLFVVQHVTPLDSNTPSFTVTCHCLLLKSNKIIELNYFRREHWIYNCII